MWRETPSRGLPSAPPSAVASGALPYAPDSVRDLLSTTDEFEAIPLSRRGADVGAIAPGPLSLDLPEGGTTFDDLEREILAQVLARADNNQSRAARSLGMSESTFRSRMKRLGLKG